MRVGIHQPNYLPWMGLIHKINESDIFVFLDDTQYSNEGGHNRNLIKTPNGKQFLTVPVNQHLGDKINMVTTKDNLPWKKKHLKSIEMNYKKAPYFEEVYSIMEELILQEYENIADMNINIIKKWCELFKIKTEFKCASDLDIKTNREQKVIDICYKVGATTYISGNGARAYQVEENFNKKGLILEYQKFETIVYPQVWKGFEENLSAIDYIMNCGFKLPW